MPKHTVYLEPYAGSLAVLFNKPRCHIETVNDLHGEVVNFFRVLRDNPDELKRLIELTPYSREEYDLAYQESDVDVERARRFCVRCWQGFGCANLYHNGFKSGQQTNSPNPAKAWAEYPDVVTQASKRLKGVQIENLPAIELIKRYNTSGPVMISGYENDLYNSILEGWRKIKKDTLAEAGVKREEVLWLNYADAQLSFEADFPEVMP